MCGKKAVATCSWYADVGQMIARGFGFAKFLRLSSQKYVLSPLVECHFTRNLFWKSAVCFFVSARLQFCLGRLMRIYHVYKHISFTNNCLEFEGVAPCICKCLHSFRLYTFDSCHHIYLFFPVFLLSCVLFFVLMMWFAFSLYFSIFSI